MMTVIDMRTRFGLAEVVYPEAGEIEMAPNVGNEESAKFIQGVYNKKGELIILVEFDKILSGHEWAEVSAL